MNTRRVVKVGVAKVGVVPLAVGRWALTAALLAAAAAASAQGAPADVTASSRVDRTAMWIADRVTYTVEIVCRRGTDVLLDDLSRDKLKLQGLDIVSTETERHDDGDATRYQFRYVLTTYRTDVPSLTVAPLDVRYYIKRAGQRAEDTAPAGSVQVPGAAIAFRSVLPDDEAHVRDTRGPQTRSSIYGLAGPVGLGLVLLAAVPVLLIGLSLARQARQRRHAAGHRSRRQLRQEERATLAEVRDASIERPESRREAFVRLDALVRRHLADTAGVPALSLTPAEIGTALAARPSRAPADAVQSILATCEAARYAPPALVPSADAWRDALARAEQLLG